MAWADLYFDPKHQVQFQIVCKEESIFNRERLFWSPAPPFCLYDLFVIHLCIMSINYFRTFHRRFRTVSVTLHLCFYHYASTLILFLLTLNFVITYGSLYGLVIKKAASLDHKFKARSNEKGGKTSRLKKTKFDSNTKFISSIAIHLTDLEYTEPKDI